MLCKKIESLEPDLSTKLIQERLSSAFFEAKDLVMRL